MADAHDDTENEILAATKRVAAQRAAGEKAEAQRKAETSGKWPVVPLAAAGIGSAALAAAVLWSRRDKGGKKD